MSKKDQIENTPLHLFTGGYMISLVNGTTFNVRITGAFKDAWIVMDDEGSEGIIPFHAVVLAVEVKEQEKEEEMYEAE
jgi:hypothetical protein